MPIPGLKLIDDTEEVATEEESTETTPQDIMQDYYSQNFKVPEPESENEEVPETKKKSPLDYLKIIDDELEEDTKEIKNEIDNLVDDSGSLYEQYFRQRYSEAHTVGPGEDEEGKKFLSDTKRNWLKRMLIMDRGMQNGWSGIMTPMYWAWEHSPLALLTDEDSEEYKQLKDNLTRSRLQSSGTLPMTDENLEKWWNGEIDGEDIKLPDSIGASILYTIGDLAPATATTMVGGGLFGGASKAAEVAKAAKAASKSTGILSKLKPTKSALTFAGLSVPKTYRDVYDSELEQAVDRGIDIEKAKGIATANAILQTPVEFLGDLVMGNVIKAGKGTKNLVRRLIGSGAAEVTEKGALKITNKGGLINALKGILKEGGSTFASEGFEEGLQQGISNATTNIMTGEKKVGWLEGVGESAWVGGLVGGVAGGTLSGTQKLFFKISPTWRKEKAEFKKAFDNAIAKNDKIREEVNAAWKQREKETGRAAGWEQADKQKQQEINAAWEQRQNSQEKKDQRLKQNNVANEMAEAAHNQYTKNLNDKIKVTYNGKDYTVDEFVNAKLYSKNNKKTVTVSYKDSEGNIITDELSGTQKEIAKQLKSEFLLAEKILNGNLDKQLENYDLYDSNGNKVSWDTTVNDKYTVLDKTTNTPVLTNADFTQLQKFKLSQYVLNRTNQGRAYAKYSRNKENIHTEETFNNLVDKINSKLNLYGSIRQDLDEDPNDKSKMYDDELIDDAVEAVQILVPNIGEANEFIGARQKANQNSGLITMYKGSENSGEFKTDSHTVGNGIEVADKNLKSSLSGKTQALSLTKSDVLTKDEMELLENELQKAYDNATDAKTQSIIKMFLPVNGEHNYVMLSRLTGKTMVEDTANPGKYIYYENKAGHKVTYAPTVEQNGEEVVNPLTDKDVNENESDEDKANERRRANPAAEDFDDNNGAGDANEYQRQPGIYNDTRNSLKVRLRKDKLTSGEKETKQDIKDYNDYRKEELNENLKSLNAETGNRVSLNHIKQAVLNLAEKLNVHLDGLSDKDSKQKKALGVAYLKNRYVQILRSTDGKSATHELGHILYHDYFLKHGDEGTLKELIDILSDNNLLKKIIPELPIGTYTKVEIPSELFSEILAEYGDNPNKINKLRTENEKVKNVLDKIDSMLEELDVASEFKQIQQLSEKYADQGTINQAMANIIIDDLPHSAFQFVQRMGIAVSKDPRTIFTGPKKAVVRFIAKHKPFITLKRTVDDYQSLNMALRSVHGDNKEEINRRADNIMTKLRFLRGSVGGTAQEFLFGSGLTWDRVPIADFVSLNDTFESFDNLVQASFKKLTKEEGDKLREIYKDTNMSLMDMHTDHMYRMFDLFLQVMNTFGENIGTQEFVNNLLKNKAVSLTDPKSFGKLVKDVYLLKALDLVTPAATIDAAKIQSKLNKLKSSAKFTNLYGNVTVDQVTNIFNNYKQAIQNNVLADIDTKDTGLNILNALAIYEQMTNELPYINNFAAFAQNLYTWQDHVLNYVSRASTTTRLMVQKIRQEAGAFHMPLSRSFLEYEELKQGIPVTDTYQLRPREGSDRPIKHLFDSLIQQMNTEIYRAHVFSSLETLVDFQNTVGSAVVLVKEATTTDVDEITKKIGSLIDSINEVLHSEGNIKSTKKDSDIIRELKKIKLTANEKSFLSKYTDSRITNNKITLKDIPNTTGVDINSEKVQIAKQLIDYALETNVLMEALNNTNKFLKRDNRYFSVLDEEGHVVTYKMTDEDLLTGIIGNIKTNPSYPNTLKRFVRLYKFADFAVKTGYTTYNIRFLINNFVRDYWRGLHYSPHYDTSKGKLSIIPQAADFTWTYLKTALQELLPIKAFGYIDNSVLNQLGLGRATYIQTQRDMYADLHVRNPRAKITNALGVVSRYLENQGTVIRKTELKLMCKKMGITPDIFRASPEALGELAGFTKNTLQKFGITGANLHNILTSEQLSYFNSASDTEVLSYKKLDLTEQQQQDVRSLLNGKTIQEVVDPDIVTKMYKYMQDVNIDYTRGSDTIDTVNKFVLFFKPSVNALVDSYRRPGRFAIKMVDTIIIGVLVSLFDWDDKEKDPRNSENNKTLNLKILKDMGQRITIDPEDGMALNLGMSLFNSSPFGIPSFILSSYIDEFKGVVVRPTPALNVPVLAASKWESGAPYKVSNLKYLYSDTIKHKIKDDVSAGIDGSVTTGSVLLSSLWNKFVDIIPETTSLNYDLKVTPIMTQTLINDVVGGYVAGVNKYGSSLLDYIGINMIGVNEYNKFLLNMNKNVEFKQKKNQFLNGDLSDIKEQYNSEDIMDKRAFILRKEDELRDFTGKGDLAQQKIIYETASAMIKTYEDMLPICLTKRDVTDVLRERNNLVNMIYNYMQQNRSLEELTESAKNIQNKKRKLSTIKNKYEKNLVEGITNQGE